MRAQRSQPGNRLVSFVRASGRARARREIRSGNLELFARRTFLLFLLPVLLLLPFRCRGAKKAFALQLFDK